MYAVGEAEGPPSATASDTTTGGALLQPSGGGVDATLCAAGGGEGGTNARPPRRAEPFRHELKFGELVYPQVREVMFQEFFKYFKDKKSMA